MPDHPLPNVIPDPPPPPSRPGLLGLIGNTPLVPLTLGTPNPKVQILAKLERNNPGGSIKDRIALSMIEAGERSGELRPGKTIIEATSGNTGIGLAMVAALKGYPIVLAMSEAVSVERRKILAAFGAEFLLTPASQGTDGAIERVYELGAADPDKYFLPDQFNSPANILAHYHGTALEIWNQTQGKLTHFVTTMGTTGTLMGCSKRLRELDSKIRIIGVEPYLGHKIQGLKNLKEAYVPGIYDPRAVDEKRNIDDDAAYDMARRLARDEGLLVGMSSGAAAHAARELAREIDSGVIVTILPDGGERYLSTALFQVAVPIQVASTLSLFNTLSHRYEPFQPLGRGDKVTMYSCGPTVHRRPHIGVLRRMLCADLVRRTLEFSGYSVKHVISITDLDDNCLAEADRTGEPLRELCAVHEHEFYQDTAALCMRPAETYARASESVDHMVRLAEKLVQRGCAYEKLRSVYFDIGRIEQYGELSGKDLGKIKVGATVDLDRYEKDDPRDFTLLRRSTLPEIRKGLSTKTEWGNVRPSWHIQCAAMARAHLGDRFDIHTASVDLIFPHNENEIAQGRALTGQTPAAFWLHSELVLAGGKKMTYAEDTCVTLPDLLARGYSAREVRFFLLLQHYRQPVHLNEERLEASRAALRRVDVCVFNLRRARTNKPCVQELEGWILEMKDGFRKAMFDDLDTPAAFAQVFRLIRQTNYMVADGRLCSEHAKQVLEALREADQVLGVLLPEGLADPVLPEIERLVASREDARRQGEFERADELRTRVRELGYAIEDYPEGSRLLPLSDPLTG